ncbi:hypothetical protein VHEMI00870 [[Torrubiella] hemipterigena]|uniref:Uncharacterized protein n=1 Tax=[Torrubiella] hemipterigena TaxID=1531966 RepID=A0A0A1T3R0_9HYPO|nr:hypothetical protein VHEMI00870 [[Torrubiella] hemipterigena]
MDGLEIEDARPWDRRPGMEKKKQDIYAAKSDPPKPSDEAPATQQGTKQTTTPTAPADKTDTPETTVQITNPTSQDTSPFSKVVFQTVCRMAITFPEVVPPVTAEVTATIHSDTNTADIVMRDPVIKNSVFLVLDFRDLEEPVVASASICKLTCKSNRANSVILLSSDDPKTIQSLFTVILKLHSIVSKFNAHSMFSSSIRKRQDFQSQPVSTPTASIASPAVKAAPEQDSTPKEIKPPFDPSVECAPTPLGDLLNLDEAPTGPSAPGLTLDAAIDAVGKLYTSILSDYSIVSIKQPLDRKELRLLALDQWLAKGVISDETDDVVNDLACILDATIRLKTRVSPSSTAGLKSQSFDSTSTAKASNGIKYSLDDLRGLRIPYTGPTSTSQSPVLSATTETNEPQANGQCPKMAELEIGFGQLHIDPSEKEPLRKPADRKQQSKGLASSQWA